METVRTIGRIPSVEASQALEELARNTQPPVQWEAQNQQRQIGAVLVDRVRGAFEGNDYIRAIETGTRVLPLFQSAKDADHKADLLVLIGKSNWQLALNANARTPGDQVDKWYRECAANIQASGEARRPLDADSRRVLSSCYGRLAERMLVADPNGAIQMARKAVEADGTNAQGYASQGLVLWNTGHAREALAALATTVGSIRDTVGLMACRPSSARSKAIMPAL